MYNTSMRVPLATTSAFLMGAGQGAPDPQRKTDIAYIVLHEFFIHAAANSWDFANRPLGHIPTRPEGAEIASPPHVDVFSFA